MEARRRRRSGARLAVWLRAWLAAAALAAAAALVPGSARADDPAGAAGGRAAGDRFDTVVIDAGHGGDDQGARGAGGILEKDVVLDVAQRLRARLLDQGYRVVLTREDDRKVSLHDRVSRANEARGDLFVSIHANAAHESFVRGVETFFLSLEASDDAARALARSENEAFEGMGLERDAGGDALLGILGDLMVSEHMVESNEFARMAQQALALGDAVPSRGVKQAPFVVLMGVQMPACLVEIGFLSNPRDERDLSRGRHRGQVAEALALSITRFAERYDARRGVAARPPVAAGPRRGSNVD